MPGCDVFKIFKIRFMYTHRLELIEFPCGLSRNVLDTWIFNTLIIYFFTVGFIGFFTFYFRSHAIRLWCLQSSSEWSITWKTSACCSKCKQSFVWFHISFSLKNTLYTEIVSLRHLYQIGGNCCVENPLIYKQNILVTFVKIGQLKNQGSLQPVHDGHKTSYFWKFLQR